MNRKSLKLRELTTFYGAQDWLTNTERGQSYLYIAFPEASYRIINAMLDGDDKALEILRNMQPVSLRPVLKDFNHFIEQSARHSDVSDIVRYIQVFDDLNEADLYGIGLFLYYHPDELESLFRVRLDDDLWSDVQETVNSMNNNNLKEACIRVSDILLRNSLLEKIYYVV